MRLAAELPQDRRGLINTTQSRFCPLAGELSANPLSPRSLTHGAAIGPNARNAAKLH